MGTPTGPIFIKIPDMVPAAPWYGLSDINDSQLAKLIQCDPDSKRTQKSVKQQKNKFFSFMPFQKNHSPTYKF